MNSEFLAAAPVLALLGERLVTWGDRGEAQAGGATFIGAGALSLPIGIASVQPYTIEDVALQIIVPVYFAALLAVAGVVMLRKRPCRYLCLVMLTGVAVPLLWSFLCFGSPSSFLHDAGTGALSYEGFIPQSIHYYAGPLLVAIGYTAMAAASGALLVWGQLRQSAPWWLGVSLMALGVVILLFDLLRAALFRLNLSPA